MPKITLDLTEHEMTRLMEMSIHFNTPMEKITMMGVSQLEDLENMADAFNGRSK